MKCPLFYVEKITKLPTTSVICFNISNVTTQKPNRESAEQNKDNQTTNIIVAVVVSVVFVLLLIGLVVFLRR